MDTFSRKHRLRQLQLQELRGRGSSTSGCDKENSSCQPISSTGGTLTRKRIPRDNDEFEDDEFKVVRVLACREQNLPSETSSSPQSLKVSEASAAARPSRRTAPSPPVRCGRLTSGSGSSNDSSHCCASDSSGFSSSLYSTQVEIKFPAIERPSSQRRLIDELDRLIMHVDSAASPSESYLSYMDARQPDCTLVRSNERDNSCHCADDFSSFIALSAEAKLPDSGPCLVGVHEDRFAKRGEPGPRRDSYYATLSDAELSCDSDEGKCSAPSDSFAPDSLSTLLDRHVSKVQTLLRLAAGDRNVSIAEAFGASHDDSEIPVSEEFRTLIQLAPVVPRPNSRRIIHELEIVDLDASGKFPDKPTCIRVEGTDVPFIPPLELQVDWSKLPIVCKGVRLSEDLDTLKHWLGCKLLETDRISKCLVSKVSEHVNEFIDNYLEFHSHLRAYTTFSSDWHENWLFAYKRPTSDPAVGDHPEEQIACKRARLRSHSHLDLLSYSTLILSSRPRRLSLRYLTEELPRREDCLKIDEFYEQQREESLGELRAGTTNPSLLPDVCQLLLEDDCATESLDMKKRATAKLQVSYESSCRSCLANSGHFSFVAHGYFIQTPLLISPNTDLMRLAKLRWRTLARLERSLKVPRQPTAPSNHHVRFRINLTSVELVNKLQVVQFCAQVVGYLPIRVRWFRGAQEISNRRSEPGGERGGVGYEWPVWFHAIYDYQYRTDWGSWYRFRRNRDEILFEIRCPNKEHDYDVPYRCVIGNYCSESECDFSLKSRPVKESPSVDLNNNTNQSKRRSNGKAGGLEREAGKARAVLRTWSQRTLKPQARVLDAPLGDSKIDESQSSGKRRLVSDGLDEDRFGKDFPYHPENLLKRLRENVFSVARKSKGHLEHRLEGYAGAQVSPTGCDQQIHFEALEELQVVHPDASPKPAQPMTPAVGDSFTGNALADCPRKEIPKPQNRQSKITADARHLQSNQNSRMIDHKSSWPDEADRIGWQSIAPNNHESVGKKAAPTSQGGINETGLSLDGSTQVDLDSNYQLKTCVKSLISKFNMA